ncbi:polyprenyl synthetase family protein [Enemella sp. A6]|uniref:polyprenyl synthetase family protein n=1 Tax=Enemella sp. A6 TaxID=3440152 RepID=UPI003EBF155D
MELHLDPRQPLSEDFRRAVGEAIDEFIAARRPELAAIGPEVAALADRASEFTAGGKRVRPAFCVWGNVAVRGVPADPSALLWAAASLDVLHVSALVHDDVMDASDTRRGVPAAHRQFEALHRDSDWLGEPLTFGRAGAILLGDLLTMWSVQMVDQSPLRGGLSVSDLARALPFIESMRTEVTAGQFLDIVAQAQPFGDPDRAKDEAHRVVEYKTARYTVQRPLQFGAALADGDEAQLTALAAYGSPLGRAFQFRDDVMGIFGDSAVTGKPAGDDLREGKRTLLLAHAFAGTTEAGARRLTELVGNPALAGDELAEARDIIAGSGAREQVEQMIEDCLAEALNALDTAEFSEVGREGLTALAHAAVNRSH